MSDFERLQASIVSNPVKEEIDILRSFADAIAHSVTGSDTAPQSMIVCGPPGMGKNFIIERALRKHKVAFRRVFANSRQGFVQAYRKAKAEGQRVLLHDETDHYWNSGGMTSVMKLATVPIHAGERRLIADDLKAGAAPVDVTRIATICLTNKNLRDYSRFDKGNRENLEAINSRCQPFVMAGSYNPLALYEYVCYLVVVEGVLKRDHYSLAVANDALRFFGEKFYRQPEVSVRQIEYIALMRHSHQHTWRGILERGLKPPPENAAQLPPVPIYQISLRPRPAKPEPPSAPAPPATKPQSAPQAPAATSTGAYEWKAREWKARTQAVMLPVGTQLRYRKHAEHIAVLQGDLTFQYGKASFITPRGFHLAVVIQRRYHRKGNTWEELWVKRPTDSEWILAEKLRDVTP